MRENPTIPLNKIAAYVNFDMVGRMRDKWPVENTIARLDDPLANGNPAWFSGDDRIWLPLSLGAAVVILVADRIGGTL